MPPGGTLSQNDWPETTWKLILSQKNKDCESWGRAVLLGSQTLLLSAWVPLPNKVSYLVSTCVSSDNSFPRVRQEPALRPWKGSPLSVANGFIDPHLLPSLNSFLQGSALGNCFCCLVVKLCQLFCDPMVSSPQVPLSVGFPRQEYWSGLPFTSPGDLPDPGIK